MLGWLGDIKKVILLSNQVWQSKSIFLYVINASNSTVPDARCFLKSMNIDLPELEIDFKSLLSEFPYTSPIFR